jgi:tetratricopeptide (TPR) repeat protein
MFREDPILGVGLGNWKVRVLEYENQVAPEFHYSIKAHNDFLENLVETGVPGGLAFITIFLGAGFVVFRSLREEKEGTKVLKALFIPGFGLFGYMVDAFFNFPADRPEIQALFAIYLAWLLFEGSQGKRDEQPSDRPPALGKIWMDRLTNVAPMVLIFVVTGWTTWAFSQNVRSLYYQLAARQEVFFGTFSKNADYFLKGYPAMPNLTCLGEPITIAKSRYLILEKRYPEAISLLKNDRTSPYDSRADYYLSLIYDKRNMTDSAIYWARSALRKQPLYGGTVLALSGTLYREGNKEEAMAMLDNYILKYPYNPKAFLFSAKWHFREGKVVQANKILASGAHVIYTDTAVAREVPVLLAMIRLYPYHIAYDSAKRLMNAGKYPEALSIFNLIVNKKPKFIETYTFRALCFSNVGKYHESIRDINHAIRSGLNERYDLINLRGVNKHKLGKVYAACQDFKKAMEHGNTQAAGNYQRFCLKK